MTRMRRRITEADPRERVIRQDMIVALVIDHVRASRLATGDTAEDEL